MRHARTHDAKDRAGVVPANRARQVGTILAVLTVLAPPRCWSSTPVALQPLAAQVRRLVETMDHLGEPFDERTRAALTEAFADTSDERGRRRIEDALEPWCLFTVRINPESRVSVTRGPAPPRLVEQGWRQFLVKVLNEAGVTAQLHATSPSALPLAGSPPDDVRNRWLDLAMFDQPPATYTLTGLGLEYRVIQLYSRDAGQREATVSFDVGQGTQDIGFRNDAAVLFTAEPARRITFAVRDEHARPTTAAFVVRDRANRVYPSQAKRLAPDLAFQQQVYRADGESIALPDGTYTISFSRGPESVPETRTVVVAGRPLTLKFKVRRWIDPTRYGYWSGDHHIHAAGCAHYSEPTQGLFPAQVIRHTIGEDLKVGSVLTWGPCFDFQSQFFEHGAASVSRYPYLLRYDLEISGFGSQFSGHLCLLGLNDPVYPGTTGTEGWPTLGLTTLRWAKKQGAVTGTAHSGFGLAVASEDLPNYEVPRYNGIGANEFIVDVTHAVEGPDGRPVPAIDFFSLADTPYVWELNMWYHTLNVGFRTRVSGETDFPCITGERVGIGRSYVKIGDRFDYAAWLEGIRAGSGYVGDGRSHILNFTVDGHAPGVGDSEVALAEPATVHIAAKVAALLPAEPDARFRGLSRNVQPYWHLERARIDGTREVPVEVVVNGRPVARANLVADGVVRAVSFEVAIERTSWIAMRILGSSHTNPLWVVVGGAPLQPDRQSAEWCLRGVEQCWSQKSRILRSEELPEAQQAYDHARRVYGAMLGPAAGD
jgi:hypothetical protein